MVGVGRCPKLHHHILEGRSPHHLDWLVTLINGQLVHLTETRRGAIDCGTGMKIKSNDHNERREHQAERCSYRIAQYVHCQITRERLYLLGSRRSIIGENGLVKPGYRSTVKAALQQIQTVVLMLLTIAI